MHGERVAVLASPPSPGCPCMGTGVSPHVLGLTCPLLPSPVPPPGAGRDDGVAQAPGRVLQLPEAVSEERGRGEGLLPVGAPWGIFGDRAAGGGSPGGLGARSWAAGATIQRTRAGGVLLGSMGCPQCSPPQGLTPLPTTTSVTAVKLPDGVTFIVYEFWETEEDWKR